MIEEVWTGGQTGADQAAWRAARAAGIATGGMMSGDYETEDGPRPEFAGLYGAVANPSIGYADRRSYNVMMSHGCVLFGDPRSPGGLGMQTDCRAHRRPLLVVRAGHTKPSDVVEFCRINGITRLMVGGNRASKDPELGAKVERFLAAVFRLMSRA